MDFIAIDFETANASRDSACSLGMVKVVNNQVVGEWYELIKPPTMHFDYRNIMIHGITPEDVKNSKNFGELWPDIQGFTADFPLIAHNAAFDFSVLRYCLDTYQLEYPELNYFCTVIAAKVTWPHLSRHDLHTVSGSLHFKFNHHNALEDARACANILVKACEQNDAKTLEEYCTKSCTTLGKLFKTGYSPASKTVKKKARKKP